MVELSVGRLGFRCGGAALPVKLKPRLVVLRRLGDLLIQNVLQVRTQAASSFFKCASSWRPINSVYAGGMASASSRREPVW